jgi:hypothetical protein
MGYNTTFNGVLKFSRLLTSEEEDYLEETIEWGWVDITDCDFPKTPGTNSIRMELMGTGDGMGLEWNGSEKTYDMVDMINYVIWRMRSKFPDLDFSGNILAQGEWIKDRYEIVVSPGKYAKVKKLK